MKFPSKMKKDHQYRTWPQPWTAGRLRREARHIRWCFNISGAHLRAQWAEEDRR